MLSDTFTNRYNDLHLHILITPRFLKCGAILLPVLGPTHIYKYFNPNYSHIECTQPRALHGPAIPKHRHADDTNTVTQTLRERIDMSGRYVDAIGTSSRASADARCLKFFNGRSEATLNNTSCPNA